jgi:hypothetical protein
MHRQSQILGNDLIRRPQGRHELERERTLIKHRLDKEKVEGSGPATNDNIVEYSHFDILLRAPGSIGKMENFKY